MHQSLVTLAGRAAIVGLAIASTGAGAQGGPLFPEPFRVEHHLEIDDGGELFVGETVVDTYGESWIVSQRPDGSRLIVDLARRELTELRPATGTYSTVALGHLGEVARRARRVQSRAMALSESPGEAGTTGASRPLAGRTATSTPPAFAVTELTAPPGTGAMTVRAAGLPGSSMPDPAPALRRLQVKRNDAPGRAAAVEVWVDPSLRLTAEAVDALELLEQELLSTSSSPDGDLGESPGRYLTAARRFADGAIAVRTVRPIAVAAREGGSTVTRSDDHAAEGRIVDVASRVERLSRFPRELLEIPESLRREPHPLEATVRFLESERQDEELLTGDRAGRELLDGRPQ